MGAAGLLKFLCRRRGVPNGVKFDCRMFVVASWFQGYDGWGVSSFDQKPGSAQESQPSISLQQYLDLQPAVDRQPAHRREDRRASSKKKH